MSAVFGKVDTTSPAYMREANGKSIAAVIRLALPMANSRNGDEHTKEKRELAERMPLPVHPRSCCHDDRKQSHVYRPPFPSQGVPVTAPVTWGRIPVTRLIGYGLLLLHSNLRFEPQLTAAESAAQAHNLPPDSSRRWLALTVRSNKRQVAHHIHRSERLRNRCGPHGRLKPQLVIKGERGFIRRLHVEPHDGETACARKR